MSETPIETRMEQPALTLPISVGAMSEIGRREQNQDCMTGFSSPFGAVYLIADGMGGYRGGAEASRMVAEAFARHLLAAPVSSPTRDAVTLAVRLANVEILEKGKSAPELEGMGSTVVIALVRQTGNGMDLTTAHVGDSRIYLQREGDLRLLTKDHTQVQWLLDNHSIDEAAARNHPDASVLTRAIGHTTNLEVDLSDPIPLQEGDGIMLCSDGLSGFASTGDIQNILRQNPDPSSCAHELIKLALASGSDDNITVQFLRIGQLAEQHPQGEPKRRTEPEGTVLPLRSPFNLADRPSLRFLIPALLLLLVVALSSALLWRAHSRKVSAVAATPRSASGEEGGKALPGDLEKFHNEASRAQQAVQNDLAELAKLSVVASTPALQKREKTLKTGFETLGKNLGDLADSRQLQTAALERAKTTKKELESSKSQLEADWKAAAHVPKSGT